MSDLHIGSFDKTQLNNPYMDIHRNVSAIRNVIDTTNVLNVSKFNSRMPNVNMQVSGNSGLKSNRDMSKLNYMMMNGTKTNHHKPASMVSGDIYKSLIG